MPPQVETEVADDGARQEVPGDRGPSDLQTDEKGQMDDDGGEGNPEA